MKHIGFLSFGHWTASPHSSVQSGSDALLQSIELAVAAEELGADGAYFRVHHFARQLGSPFPLLAAIGARTSRIEIGTAVIDMRYENPFYMVEDAGAADLIAGGRLQLGISRGSPEQVIDGFRHFGYVPQEGEDDGAMARRHAQAFLQLLDDLAFLSQRATGEDAYRHRASRGRLGQIAKLVGKDVERGDTGCHRVRQTEHDPTAIAAATARSGQRRCAETRQKRASSYEMCHRGIIVQGWRQDRMVRGAMCAT